MQEDLLRISGTVDSVIFHSEDSGFTVLDLETDNELISVVGEFAEIDEGEELILTGRYVNHPSYGLQFRAEGYERKLPSNENAIYKYLASRAVKGIGPATARRIVDAFGAETLEVLENDPERLATVRGISYKKALEISEEFKQLFGMRSVMLFLSQYGISASQGIKAWKKWGSMAADIIRENPYAMCAEPISLSFSQADAIAEKMGFEPEDENRIRAALTYVLTRNLSNGHTCLPQDKLIAAAQSVLRIDMPEISSTLEGMLSSGALASIERGKRYVYLPGMLLAERYIARRLIALASKKINDDENIEKRIDKIEKKQGIKYAGLQRHAISMALKSSVFILTGGPGTGKTTTLNAIIALLEEEGKTVFVTAPTGRAAKRISEVTGKDAKTVHRLLEVKFDESKQTGFVHNEDKPLACDALVIDEMSMMDTLLFDSLLRALPIGSKLIIVGDSDQLPSVGPGNVLKDMLDSGVIPAVSLTEIFRQSAESLIVMNAHSIVNGEMPDISRVDKDFFFISRKDIMSTQQTVVDLCAVRLPKSYGFDPMEDIEVLCPGRKGETGTKELNRMLQERLNPPISGKREYKHGDSLFREGDKVMQIKNNYDIPWTKNGEEGLGIFNGDIGIIQSINKADGTITISFDDKTAIYTFDMASELELAYAVTVHKSQGSEFNAVIMPIFGGYDKLYYRNLLYTGVTRAKKILILVGSKNRLKYMVDNNLKTLRYTGLKHFLMNWDG